jgi:hypothetical protein
VAGVAVAALGDGEPPPSPVLPGHPVMLINSYQMNNNGVHFSTACDVTSHHFGYRVRIQIR